MLKDARPEFLLAAIRTVHTGAAVIAPSAVGHLLDTFGSGGGRRDDALGALSPREREIYALAGRGMSNAEIAAHEFVSEATVKTHVNHLLSKLHLDGRPALVAWAWRHGVT